MSKSDLDRAMDKYVNVDCGPRVKYGVPASAVLEGPWVQWSHCDGPALHWAGNVDWLTWSERARLLFRWATIDEIACTRWPFLQQVRSNLRALKDSTNDQEENGQ